MGRDSDRRPFPDGQSVYHQLRWDPRFDADACEIVLADRPVGTKVIAFREFLPNGPIPWHRIIGFRYRGAVLWDRAERIDRRDDALAGTLGRTAPTVAVDHLPLLEAEVTPARQASLLPAEPAIVTWNVLSDAWDGALLDHPTRWKALLDEALATGAGILVFTEVSDGFFAQLTAHPLVGERYTIVSSEHADVAILSSAPPKQAHRVEFAPGREAIVCWFDDLVVAGLHLPSDRESSRRAERERDLERLSQTLLGSWSLVIAGDFNAQDDELAPLITRLHGLDAWSAANPSSPGLTYDVEKNPVAGALTKRGRSSRLDRILVFGERLDCGSARLLGTGQTLTSDHFGLLATLRPRTSTTTSHRTAVVLVPPRETLGPLQRLRARFDPRFERWPPHVSLLYGFVEPARLEASFTGLSAVAASVPPFDVELDRVITFEHESSTTVALAPSRPEAVRALQAKLVAAFPFCTEQNRGEGGTFTPHLTVARLSTADAKTVAEVTRALRAHPLRWRAEAITVLERPDETFRVRETFGLGDGLRRTDASPPARADDLEREVRAAVDDTLDDLCLEATVAPFGSRAWGPSLPGRDLDLLVTIGDAGSQRFLDGLAQRLPSGRRVNRQVLRGERFDVIAIDAGADDDDSRRFSLGVTDAQALRAALERHGRAEVFDATIPQVREWSRRRALEGNAFGYFGGIGWAVLLASPLLHDPVLASVTPKEAFAAWARWLGALDRRALVSLHPSPRFEADGFTVLSPASPWRPITRALIPSTTATLFEEFQRLGRGDDGDAIEADAWLTVRGPAEDVGAWQQRCLWIFSSLDRDLGPVLRVRGEPPAIEGDTFTSRIGLRTRDSGRVQQRFVAHTKRLDLPRVRAFVTPG